jgi:hypothetical protein
LLPLQENVLVKQHHFSFQVYGSAESPGYHFNPAFLDLFGIMGSVGDICTMDSLSAWFSKMVFQHPNYARWHRVVFQNN